jgi:hypothetical protein
MPEMTLCFAENIPEGIQEILKTHQKRIEASYNLMKCKKKSRFIEKKKHQTLNWILSRLLY